MKKSTQIFRDGTHKCESGGWTTLPKLRVWCSRLTGIDPVPVAPPAVGVRAEVRAKKTPTSGAARAGIPDGGGRWSRWGVPAKARTPLRSIPDLADVADGDGDVPTC